jgi:hypothetical protein
MTRSWAADARPSTYAEGRERPAVSWSDVKIIALLSHLESNKGPQGLYMKDQSTALKEAQAAVVKVTPPGETFPEPRHIAGKHYRLVVKFTPEEETRKDCRDRRLQPPRWMTRWQMLKCPTLRPNKQ